MFGFHPDAIKPTDKKYAKEGPVRGNTGSPDMGFHPQMYLAGGGLIEGLKRAVGLKEDTPEQKAYKERAAAERAAPKPAAAAVTPPKAITSYAAGTATASRMKAADEMADGGEVVGPGTGTSDEVPIMGSNGEYMIRKAAVDVVGINVLDAINALGEDASDDDDADDKVPGKYATGGVINKYGTEVPNTQDEQARLANQTASYVTGAQAANPVASPPATKPTPAAPGAEAQMSYGDQMANVGKFFVNGAGTALKTIVSAPGYGFNRDMKPPSLEPAAPMQTAANAAPAVAAPASTPTPQRPSATVASPNPATGSPDQAMPGGIVNVSRQANGVTSFSGKDIAGQPQYAGSAAGGIRGGVMNSVPGMSQSDITKTLTNSDGSQWSTRDNAIMAANIRDGIDPYKGTSQGQANELRALALSPNGTPGKSNAMKMLTMQSDEKRTTGQQQIERERNAPQAQGSLLDNQAKQQLLAAQTELANAKTPAEEAAAEKKLRALQGKSKEAIQKYTVYNLPDTIGENGVVARGGQGALDMEGRPIDIRQPGAAQLPPGMVKQIGTANGKPVYLDKDGKQVIAKG